MARPNFFLVGAPKCGTSAVAYYLREHPSVFMSWPKEPLFFCEDFPGARVVKEWQDYAELFEAAPSDAAVVGEASAMYLYSSVALERIRSHSPDARIIAMVRSPIELVQAFHAQLLYSLTEDVADLGTAWSLQAARREGRNLPPRCVEPAFLQYARVGMLGRQIARLYSVFPADQVLVLRLEDLARDARAVYLEVLEFLGVEDDGRRSFEPVNETSAHKSNLISRLTQRPPERLVGAARAVKSAIGLKNASFLDPIRRLNSRRAVRERLAPAIRRDMVSTFRADVEELSRLLNQDLSHWLEG
jgi:hypothetical protein